ncbi:MAG: hypothetical protein ACTSUO_07275 [Candidatus Thorarchaeota archaeon]
METESHSNDSSELSQEELLDKAKQFLALTALVEKYPEVVERRVMGLIFILIGGAISFATLIFTNIINLVGWGDETMFLVIAFVIICLGLGFGITLKVITPIYKSYGKPESSKHDMSKTAKITWGVLTFLIIAVSIYVTFTNQMFLFAIFIQIFLAIGNGGNYYDSYRNQDGATPTKELLIFAIIIALSIIPMLLFLEWSTLILIVVDMGGIYIIGIYMLLTAEKMLLESSGR